MYTLNFGNDAAFLGTVFDGSRSPNSKREAKKRADDLRFLARLRNATYDELRIIHNNHKHKGTPTWKRIALVRALLRFPP